MTVSTKEEARDLPAATRTGGAPVSRLELEIRDGRRPPLRIGDFVELPPCLEPPSATKPPYRELEAFAEGYGRACPRVELDQANSEAATLFWMTVREDSRSLVAPFMQTLGRRLTKEQQERVLARTWAALGDEEICRAMYPPPDPKKPAGGRR